MKRLVVVVLVGGLLASCGGSATKPSHSQSIPTAGGGCTYRGVLPDPACTPGATNPDVTQATIGSTICVKGWTSTVRPPVSVTQPIKTQVEIRYGVAGPHPKPFAVEELDHLIPLELGGATQDVKNLWPEPAPSYHVKDLTENRLRQEVCAGTVKLADAQRAISSNWQTAP